MAQLRESSAGRTALRVCLAMSSFVLAGCQELAQPMVAPPARLVFKTQPTDATAGAPLPVIEVVVTDSLGNQVVTATDAVTLAIGTSPAGATLSGTTTVPALAGVARFNDLVIKKAGSGYALVASSGTLVGAGSDTFSVAAAAPAAIVFTTQPTNATAGRAIAPAVQVTVQDAQGNTVPGSTASVTVALGTNPAGGTLGGTKTVSAEAGLATFADLTVDKVGTGYTLSATSGALSGSTSSGFAVSPGAAAQLVFKTQPTIATAGAPLPVIEVVVTDSLGNQVVTATDAVTLAIGTNPTGATLSGTTTVPALAGLATFNDLVIEKSADGYSLVASSGTLAGAGSHTFRVAAGAPAAIEFTTQPPASVEGNVPIAPAVDVTIRDAFGNPASGQVTVALAATLGTGLRGKLLGTRTVDAAGGVASFSTLRIDRPGAGYQLKASAGAVLTTSAGFDVRLSFRSIGANGNGGVADHTCGLTLGGAYCWGGNNNGQLGVSPDSASSDSVPLPVSGGLAFTSISIGSGHTCGIDAGVAYCWGSNGAGELGIGSPGIRSAPVQVAAPAGVRFAAISAAEHTCGLATTGAIYCWGPNGGGQIGNGTVENATTPALVVAPAGVSFVAVSAGLTNSCGLTTSGDAYCWGTNVLGALGIGSDSGPETCYGSPCSTKPVRVAAPAGLRFVSLSAGAFHTCGISSGGAAYCWGVNSRGQLGDGTTASRSTPVLVVGGFSFVSISAGVDHTCGIVATDPGAVCWGSNVYGTLGDNTTWDHGAPIGVSLSSPGTQVSAGWRHTCALAGTTAYCWGQNDVGQLGDGSQLSHLVPTRVVQ